MPCSIAARALDRRIAAPTEHERPGNVAPGSIFISPPLPAFQNPYWQAAGIFELIGNRLRIRAACGNHIHR